MCFIRVFLIVLCVLVQNAHAVEINFECTDCFFHATNVAGDSAEAKLKNLEVCKQTCAKNHDYEFYLADHLMGSGKLKEAEQLLNDSISKYKDDTKKLKYMLMHLYFCVGHSHKLLNMAEKMIEIYPEWFGGYQFKGMYNIQFGSMQEAYKLFTKAIEKENNVDSHLGLVVYYYNIKDFKLALNEYELAYNAGDRLLIFTTKDVAAIAAHSAMELGKISTAEWILNMQKKFVKNIENYDRYKQARERLNKLKLEKADGNKK